MTDLSLLLGQTQIKKVDEKTAIRYKVIEEPVDLGLLEIEKKGIEEQLAKVLSDEELLVWAKENYPYQKIDTATLQARLKEINSILEVK